MTGVEGAAIVIIMLLTVANGIIRGRTMGWSPASQSWLEDAIKKALKK